MVVTRSQAGAEKRKRAEAEKEIADQAETSTRSKRGRCQKTTPKGPSQRATEEESRPGQAVRDAPAPAPSGLGTLNARLLELEAREHARVREIAYLKAALEACRQDAASFRARSQAPTPSEEQAKWNCLWLTLTSMRQLMQEEIAAVKDKQREFEERIQFDGIAIRGEQREIRRLVPEELAAMRAEIRESSRNVMASLTHIYHQQLARFGEAMG
ncbi:hypothetical protein PMG11_09663 [Penicillium brasilianum]|uniref:Uncharacterized protein n=1 Tax=Penicillium brasilianum TaxID=104259 RepID=A0A0F7TYW9_PENBI|nr:hypothetical protein PMG11_09663 [Penicillium brasilianum]